MNEQTMQEYKKQLRARLAKYGGLLGLTTVTLALLPMENLPARHQSDFVHGFRLGVTIFLIIVLLIAIFRTNAALRNDEKLRAQYICETDERTRMIREKIGGTPFEVFYILLGIAAIVAGYLNSTVFFTMLAVQIAYGIYRLALKIYYQKKY